MPNLADFVLAIAWLALLFFFLSTFQLARVVADVFVNHDAKTATLWKPVFAVAIFFFYLVYLVIAREMMQLAGGFTPVAEFPRQSSGIGIVSGVVLYGAFASRSTWPRRKRRARQCERQSWLVIELLFRP